MAARIKPFDCVDMKNAIQRDLAKEWKGLSDEEIRRRIHRRLETSDDPLARWWRSVRDPKAGSPDAKG